MVNKVIDFAKREKRICLVLKVYYEKAYDSICWNYLRFCFNKIGFGGEMERMDGGVCFQQFYVDIG